MKGARVKKCMLTLCRLSIEFLMASEILTKTKMSRKLVDEKGLHHWNQVFVKVIYISKLIHILSDHIKLIVQLFNVIVLPIKTICVKTVVRRVVNLSSNLFKLCPYLCPSICLYFSSLVVSFYF